MLPYVKESILILSDAKTLYPKISDVIHKFQSSLCNKSYYGKGIRLIDIRSEKHIIGVSPLIKKKAKPNSAVRDHLLHCNYLPSFSNFSIFTQESKKMFIRNKHFRELRSPTFLSEIKESLLIMRDKTSLSRDSSTRPYLIKSLNDY